MKKLPLLSIVVFVFGIFMSLVYVGVGLFFVFSPKAAKLIAAPYHWVFAGLLMLYGLGRLFRSYQKYKENKLL
ncbi:hypothetical protein SAMN05421780_102413 [Flexibacter flexilis DSM 6793]|uniref:Uncharacterized protein n=1 Tax=Flexibacter flexilis DSM 6793 TaxID=927664 RepID=A0A1I1G1S1_9BACT|nr:hypothetical protein [Flexibacter flexilis]SFC05485.1 hypothetical protein SAMN05421780_102413 [Flexibacter flexilis DSM 6793]